MQSFFTYLPPSDVRIWYENWKKYVQILRKLDVYLFDIKEIPREFQGILKDHNIKIPKNIDGGVFAYVPEGVKVNIPVEIAYYVENYDQKIYNVIILGKSTEITIYTGCVSLAKGSHKSLTYEYVGKNAKATTVKIHLWQKESSLYAKTLVKLEDGFVNSYYLDLYSEGTIDFRTKYIGAGHVSEKSVILGKGNLNLVSIAKLKSGSAELISKVVSFNNSKIKTLQKVEALGKIKGYIKCDGLLFDYSSQGTMPILSSKCKDAELHHEAKLGKVSKEILEYLESKGLTEEEAIALYVRGFVTSLLPELDERLKLQILALLSRAQGL